MKKFLTLVIIFAFITLLAGCNDIKSNTNETTPDPIETSIPTESVESDSTETAAPETTAPETDTPETDVPENDDPQNITVVSNEGGLEISTFVDYYEANTLTVDYSDEYAITFSQRIWTDNLSNNYYFNRIIGLCDKSAHEKIDEYELPDDIVLLDGLSMCADGGVCVYSSTDPGGAYRIFVVDGKLEIDGPYSDKGSINIVNSVVISPNGEYTAYAKLLDGGKATVMVSLPDGTIKAISKKILPANKITVGAITDEGYLFYVNEQSSQYIIYNANTDESIELDGYYYTCLGIRDNSFVLQKKLLRGELKGLYLCAPDGQMTTIASTTPGDGGINISEYMFYTSVKYVDGGWIFTTSKDFWNTINFYSFDFSEKYAEIKHPDYTPEGKPIKVDYDYDGSNIFAYVTIEDKLPLETHTVDLTGDGIDDKVEIFIIGRYIPNQIYVEDVRVTDGTSGEQLFVLYAHNKAADMVGTLSDNHYEVLVYDKDGTQYYDIDRNELETPLEDQYEWLMYDKRVDYSVENGRLTATVMYAVSPTEYYGTVRMYYGVTSVADGLYPTEVYVEGIENDYYNSLDEIIAEYGNENCWFVKDADEIKTAIDKFLNPERYKDELGEAHYAALAELKPENVKLYYNVHRNNILLCFDVGGVPVGTLKENGNMCPVTSRKDDGYYIQCGNPYGSKLYEYFSSGRIVAEYLEFVGAVGLPDLTDTVEHSRFTDFCLKELSNNRYKKTAENLTWYVETVFGITDFEIPDDNIDADGNVVYYPFLRGDVYCPFLMIDAEVNGSDAIVTIQYYSDYSYQLATSRFEYTLTQNEDGIYVYTSIVDVTDKAFPEDPADSVTVLSNPGGLDVHTVVIPAQIRDHQAFAGCFKYDDRYVLCLTHNYPYDEEARKSTRSNFHLYVIDVSIGEIIHSQPIDCTDRPTALTYSPDGGVLLSGGPYYEDTAEYDAIAVYISDGNVSVSETKMAYYPRYNYKATSPDGKYTAYGVYDDASSRGGVDIYYPDGTVKRIRDNRALEDAPDTGDEGLDYFRAYIPVGFLDEKHLALYVGGYTGALTYEIYNVETGETTPVYAPGYKTGDDGEQYFVRYNPVIAIDGWLYLTNHEQRIEGNPLERCGVSKVDLSGNFVEVAHKYDTEGVFALPLELTWMNNSGSTWEMYAYEYNHYSKESEEYFKSMNHRINKTIYSADFDLLLEIEYPFFYGAQMEDVYIYESSCTVITFAER